MKSIACASVTLCNSLLKCATPCAEQGKGFPSGSRVSVRNPMAMGFLVDRIKGLPPTPPLGATGATVVAIAGFATFNIQKKLW